MQVCARRSLLDHSFRVSFRSHFKVFLWHYKKLVFALLNADSWNPVLCPSLFPDWFHPLLQPCAHVAFSDCIHCSTLICQIKYPLPLPRDIVFLLPCSSICNPSTNTFLKAAFHAFQLSGGGNQAFPCGLFLLSIFYPQTTRATATVQTTISAQFCLFNAHWCAKLLIWVTITMLKWQFHLLDAAMRASQVPRPHGQMLVRCELNMTSDSPNGYVDLQEHTLFNFWDTFWLSLQFWACSSCIAAYGAWS